MYATSLKQDASWLAARELGHLVRVDSLRKGQQFRPMTGGVYTFLRQHGANRGAFCVKGPDGSETCFAGCATVQLVPDLGALSRECDDATLF